MAGVCVGLFVIVVMIGFSLMQSSPKLETELESEAAYTRLIDASRELRTLAAKAKKESKRG